MKMKKIIRQGIDPKERQGSRQMKDNKSFRCCICGKEEVGYGNNPDPVLKNKGDRCCNFCNNTVIIPERKKQIEQYVLRRKHGRTTGI